MHWDKNDAPSNTHAHVSLMNRQHASNSLQWTRAPFQGNQPEGKNKSNKKTCRDVRTGHGQSQVRYWS